MDPSSPWGGRGWIHHPCTETEDGPIIPPWRRGPSPSLTRDASPSCHRLCSSRTPVASQSCPNQLAPPAAPVDSPHGGQCTEIPHRNTGKMEKWGGGVAWGESSRRNSHGMVKSMVLNPHFSLFQWGWREDVTPCVIKPPISSHHTFGCSCSSWQHRCGAVLPSWATAAGAGWARWCCQLLCHTLGSVLSFPHLWKDTGGVCRRVLHLLNSSQPSPSFGLTQVIFSTFFISSLSVRC